MTFATRCPQCKTVFQVEDKILALRSGLVRCGVCQTPFNGIQNLLGRIAPQQETPVEPPVETPTIEQPTPAIQTPAPATPVTAVPTAAAPATFAATATEPVMAAVDDISSTAPAGATTNEPVLSDNERALQEAFDRQLASFSLDLDNPEPAKTVAAPDADQKTEPTLTNNPVDPTPAPAVEVPETDDPATQKKKGHPVLWLIGCLILIVVLCLQGIYFYSKDIVETAPDLEEPVEAVCDMLSCPVEQAEAPVTKPAFNITDTKRSADKEKANTVILSAVLTNTSKEQQPLPTQAIELTDKDGKVLARRPVTPQDYDAPDDLIAKGLAPSQSTPVSIHFEHSQSSAVSSRLVVSDSSKK